MEYGDELSDFATCVYDNGVFTGCRVLTHGEPIWTPAVHARSGEVIVSDYRVEGGLERVSRKGSGIGR